MIDVPHIFTGVQLIKMSWAYSSRFLHGSGLKKNTSSSTYRTSNKDVRFYLFSFYLFVPERNPMCKINVCPRSDRVWKSIVFAIINHNQWWSLLFDR